MPRTNNPLDLAAHYTQLYYELYKNGGNSHDDITFLEAQSINVSHVARKEGSSQQVRDLSRDIDAFTKMVQSNARYMAEGGQDRERIKKQQLEASKLAGNIIKGFQQVPAGEAAQYDFDEKDYLLKGWTDPKVRPANMGGSVLKACGESKSAAKWIESFQKGVGKGREIPADQVALIFAARQLSNAQLGKRANIDKTQLSELEIRSQADKLMASPEFKKFVAQVGRFDEKLFRDGHGGKLEQSFQKFLTEEGKAELDFDVKNRYGKQISDANKLRRQQSDWVDVDGAKLRNEYNNERIKVTPQAREQYKSFGDYFKRNSAENLEGTLSPLVRAARLAAADHLSRTKPELPFDRKALDSRARRFMKDPGFKIVTRLPGAMEKILGGDAQGFSDEVSDVKTAAGNLLDGIHEHLRTNGVVEPSLSRLEANFAAEPDEFPDLKAVTDSVRRLQQGGEHKPEEVINAIGGILDYQDRHAADKLSSRGAVMNDTMRLLHEMTKGTYLDSLVEHQIGKVNEARQAKEFMGKSQFLTTDYIAQEGREEAAKASQPKQADLEKKPEAGPGAPVA